MLLNNWFVMLFYVVGEGCWVIGNIEWVVNLFLIKMVYFVLLVLLVGIECLIVILLWCDLLLFLF